MKGDIKVTGQLHLHCAQIHHGKMVYGILGAAGAQAGCAECWGSEKTGTGGRFRMPHLLPFWKNSSRLSLNGCRYSFGDSLHTTAICFSLAVKRRRQSDFLKNTDLLNPCSVLCIKCGILTHHYLSKLQGKKQNQKTKIITHSIPFFRNREMHHLQPFLIFLKKRSKTSDFAQVKNSAFWSLEREAKAM